MMTPHQHPKVAVLQQRLEEARSRGDDSTQRDTLAQLRRIEIRELSADQLDAQAQYIAGQCEGRNAQRQAPRQRD
jgi:hypothetical protein